MDTDNTCSLYLHIPFCSHKCPYCDFNTYAVREFPEEQYVNALIREYDFYRENILKNNRISSVYFGGGTPSLLSAGAVLKLIGKFSADFCSADIEISLEANPGEISLDKLKAFYDAGVNRISFGSQSFSEKTLKTLGRKHDPEDIYLAVKNCQLAGINNFNLDLIFAVPGETLEDLQSDLKNLISLNPPHVSCYELTIEKGTPFYQSLLRGVFVKTDDCQAAEFYKLICQELENAKISQYEISNFAVRGYESRHNSRYWERYTYLGLGAGAHSFINAGYGVRFANLAQVNDYINAITQNGQAQSWKETLNRDNAMTEFFMLGLRKISGVNLSDFESVFGNELRREYESRLKTLANSGFINISGNIAKLTSSGLLLADKIFAELT